MTADVLDRQAAAVTALASLIAAQRAAGVEAISWRISRWNLYAEELAGVVDGSAPLADRVRHLRALAAVLDVRTEPVLTVYGEEQDGGGLTVTSTWGGVRVQITAHLVPADVVELRVPDGLPVPGGEA